MYAWELLNVHICMEGNILFTALAQGEDDNSQSLFRS